MIREGKRTIATGAALPIDGGFFVDVQREPLP